MRNRETGNRTAILTKPAPHRHFTEVMIAQEDDTQAVLQGEARTPPLTSGGMLTSWVPGQRLQLLVMQWRQHLGSRAVHANQRRCRVRLDG